MQRHPSIAGQPRYAASILVHPLMVIVDNLRVKSRIMFHGSRSWCASLLLRIFRRIIDWTLRLRLLNIHFLGDDLFIIS